MGLELVLVNYKLPFLITVLATILINVFLVFGAVSLTRHRNKPKNTLRFLFGRKRRKGW
ncbi:MAG: hypothetical protein ACXAEU_20630 [Candidatus Hodarchaeales archaeon]